MATKIDSVESRDRLTPRRTPYWQRLSSGCHVGFRKMSANSAGTWLAQVYDGATRKQTRSSLGSFDAMPASQRYDAAKKAAEKLAEHLNQGGTPDDINVKQACADYVKFLRAEGKDETADDAEARFKRWIDSEKIASVSVRKLATHHLREWRTKLVATEVVINPRADVKLTRKRAPSTVNRDMTSLRAALNHARENGAVTTDAGWRAALKPIDAADGKRTLFLDRTQRKALIENAQADVGVFLRGLALVPLRPGALAALTAGSFDKRIGVLTIGKDKAGNDRSMMLPKHTAALFAGLAKDKLPAAPLFARADGKAWDKDSWKKPVKAAAATAKLPATTTAYTLRHSVITDLIVGGLDTLTVARLSGTSLPMIERHYGHLRAAHAAAALATLAL